MAEIHLASPQPYTRDQLEQVLVVLQAVKEGLREPANGFGRGQKFGLRSRSHDDTFALPVPMSMPMSLDDVDDDTSDEDFDPSEEMRERMRELRKRRLALRNADDGEEDTASSSNKRVRTESGELNVSFKFNMPMSKWFLRSLDEEEDTSAPSLPAFLGTAAFPLSSSCGVETATANGTFGDDDMMMLGTSDSPVDITGTGDANHAETSPVDENYRLELRDDTDHAPRSTATAGKQKETYRKTRVPRSQWTTISRPQEAQARQGPKPCFFITGEEGDEEGKDEPKRKAKTKDLDPITSDPRLVGLLRLGNADSAAHHSSHIPRSTSTIDSAGVAAVAADAGEEAAEGAAVVEPECAAAAAADWLTEESMRSAQAKYQIIPNLVSVKTRRPRWMRRAAAAHG